LKKKPVKQRNSNNGQRTELSFENKRVSAPVATSSVMSSNTSTPTGVTAFPLRRKEYVGEIAGSVAFAITKYSLNPGLAPTFPWGSQISPSFEEYDTLSVAFHYEPESASSATGAVMIAFDYDAADSTPATKQEMLTFADNVRVAPWVPCTLVLKTIDLKKRGTLFTRTGTIASTDIKTYDLGNVFVATQGQAGTTTVGEFWISYNFSLRTPQPFSFADSLSAKVVAGGTVSFGAYLGTAPTITGKLPVTASGATLTFGVVGSWLLGFTMVGTGLTGTAPTITGTATTTGYNTYVAGNSDGLTNDAILTVNVTAVGQTVIIDWDPAATTVTGATVRIGAYAYSDA
jgi:hypothetical protein